jgi:DNA invertase Pin-like site-specific DNA recombinase
MRSIRSREELRSRAERGDRSPVEPLVVRLDRLGRSTRDLLNLVHELEQKGAGLRERHQQFSAGPFVSLLTFNLQRASLCLV